MEKISKKKNIFIHVIILLLAMLIYILTSFIAFHFLNANGLIKKVYMFFILIEIAYFIIILSGLEFLVNLLKNIKKTKKYISAFLIYLTINFILLLIVWPGVWRWDDFFIAVAVKDYYFTSWQHTFSSFYYLLALRIYPSYISIIIFQIILISLIVSYIYNRIIDYFKIKRVLYKILVFLVFLLPTVLINNLYPLRCILYSYLVLLFIFIGVDIINQKKISWKMGIFVGILLGVLASWRSEGIYYLVVMIIYIFYLKFKVKIGLKKVFVLFLVGLSTFLSIYKINNSFVSKDEDLKYKLTATLEITAELVRHANEVSEKDDLLKDIDRVVNVQMILDSKESGTWLFWNGVVREGFNKEEFDAYNKAFKDLCLAYPVVVFKQRIYEFNISSGLIKNSSNTVGDASTSFNLDVPEIIKFQEANFSKPFNKKLREKTIKLFEGRKEENYYMTTFMYPILNNLYVPIIISFIFCIYLLFKKKIMYSFIFATSLMKAVLVFATAPSGYFMYYFSDYLLGNICLVIITIMICKYFASKKKKVKQKDLA